MDNQNKVRDRSLIGMLTTLQEKLGKNALLSPPKKVYKFNFMESNASDVFRLTLNARQQRIKPINQEMQIKIAVAQQKKEELQEEYRDRILEDNKNR